MNDNSISGLKDPEFPQDAVTKNYVDHLYVRNSSGYIPININNNSKVGFVTSASSESHSSYKAFRINNSSNRWNYVRLLDKNRTSRDY